VWDAATGAEIAVVRRHEDVVPSAVFSPDGARIVTWSGDGRAWVWDAATGAEVNVLRVPEVEIGAAAFSPDGARIVIVDYDGTARMWDVATGAVLAMLGEYEGGVGAAAFSPDGTRIVTWGDDGTARVWDPAKRDSIAVQLASSLSVFIAGVLSNAALYSHLLFGLSIVAILAGVVARPVGMSRFARVLTVIMLIIWLMQELVLGFFGTGRGLGNCALFLLSPSVYVGLAAALKIYHHHPRAIKPLVMISVTELIAYLLPYALATPVGRYPLFAFYPTASQSYTVYMLGDHLAGAVSIVLVLITAVVGKWYLKRMTTQQGQSFDGPA
jgi:hypothetical protein